MIVIPAMPAPNTGQKLAAQGLFLDPRAARLSVVLVEPKIPPNTGNVARLCAVTGSRLHLVAPLGFRIDDKDLRRAGLDYWDKVHAATWSSFDELVEAEAIGAERLHLFTGHGGTSLWEARFAPGDYLVLGDDPHLVASECTECGARYFDRRNACANCICEDCASPPWSRPETRSTIGHSARMLRISRNTSGAMSSCSPTPA